MYKPQDFLEIATAHFRARSDYVAIALDHLSAGKALTADSFERLLRTRTDSYYVYEPYVSDSLAAARKAIELANVLNQRQEAA